MWHIGWDFRSTPGNHLFITLLMAIISIFGLIMETPTPKSSSSLKQALLFLIQSSFFENRLTNIYPLP